VHLGARRRAVGRARVPVGRELQGAEAEHRIGLTLVAGPAVGDAGDGPATAARNLHARGSSLGRGEDRIGPVLGPHVGGEAPARAGALEHARL
jgi:hypothetical protein